MSVKYTPVGWNSNKIIYDAFLLAAVAVYILVFIKLAPLYAPNLAATDDPIVRMRAFGSCAFLMLTFVLCIGPLARLDPRWLPVLYNRRHFGVMTAAVAAAHLSTVAGHYAALSPTSPEVALLTSNTSFGQVLGFPFEVFGMLALAILILLAVTSHDFWLSFLTPPVWKAVHMSVYVAYAAATLHIALGPLQATAHPAFAIVALCAVGLVGALHFAAARQDTAFERANPLPVMGPAWIDAGDPTLIPEKRAKVVVLPDGSRVAVFRYDGKLSAVTNACVHQNGPLGEGRILGGKVTCPWHGFQYRADDGCAPAPYTERIATYRLKLEGGHVYVDPVPNPPGTRVEPLVLDVASGSKTSAGSMT
jgi:nitrite reductase/ring-hydroxylating ferredoxin subunit/DMSO/TMAO reductase YedYZ heme-binding membrane subunit